MARLAVKVSKGDREKDMDAAQRQKTDARRARNRGNHQKKTGAKAKAKPHCAYTTKTVKAVIRAFDERGPTGKQTSLKSIREKYDISGNSVIHYWVERRTQDGI